MTDDRQKDGTAADRAERKLALWQKIISDVRFILPVVVVLVGGNVAGGIPALKTYLEPPPTVKDVQPPEHPAHFRKSLEDIIVKLEEHDNRLIQVETASERDDGKLWTAVKKNRADIRKWHGE